MAQVGGQALRFIQIPRTLFTAEALQLGVTAARIADHLMACHQPFSPTPLAQNTIPTWHTQPSNHELEIEFLDSLMVKMGPSPEAAKTTTAAAPANVGDTSSQVSKLNGQPVIVLQDSFDRTWRRTGVALDRSGFTVEDRDRMAGVYFVRYVATGISSEPTGFLGRLFSSKKDTPSTLTKYQISVISSGENQSVVRLSLIYI